MTGGMSYHRRLDVCLADLQCGIHIQSPDFQRTCSESRIDAIVTYQTARLERGEPLLFCGDIIFGEQKRVGDEVVWWIIDGQHRVAAMKRLAEIRPEDTVSVSIYDIDSPLPGAPSMVELFRLVNQSTPVPEYVIRYTMDAQRRQMYSAVETFIRRKYKVYLSDSRAPRKPNVNLTQVMDKLFKGVSFEEDGTSADHAPKSIHEICGYFEWCNDFAKNKLSPLAIDRVEAKSAKHGSVSPLYVASWDPDHSWISSNELAAKWHEDGRQVFELNSLVATPSPTAPEERWATPLPTSTASRPGIPHAIRVTVWNAAFGGPTVGVGACACCSRDINQQDYECGHVVAHAMGGSTTVDNLRPVCRACNRSMGKIDMDEFKRQYFS